jgi:hypothetical protein
VRGLIGATWRLLRSHGAAMVLVAAILLVPAELALAHARRDNDSLWILGSVLLPLVGYPWVNGALIATIARRGRSPVEPYGRTADRLPALVASSFVAGLAVALALVALIVPGLILAARWSAAIPLIVLDRAGPIGALETSNRLVRGRTRPVMGAGVLIFLSALVVAAPGLVIGELADSPWASGLGNALADIVVYVPLSALAFAVYRQVQAV